MSDNKKREIKRIRRLLQEIASLAEEEEMEAGRYNAARRYNSIIRHLEEREILPSGLFHPLNDQEATFGELGAECRMLSGYLEELEEEEEEEEEVSGGKRFDFGSIVALAPFLGQREVKKIVRKHMRGKIALGEEEEDEDEDEEGGSAPSMQMLVGLAPHLTSEDLAELVRACLSQGRAIDPGIVVALAPHMDSKDLGQIIRENLPEWFGERRRKPQAPPSPPQAPNAPDPPVPPRAPDAPAEPAFSAQDLVALHDPGAAQAMSRTEEERAGLQEIVARLRENSLSASERAELMNRLEGLVSRNLERGDA